VDSARQQLVQTKAQLAFLIGCRGDLDLARLAGYELAEDLETQAAPPLPPPRDLLERAMAARPDLRAAKANKEKADANVDLARRQRIPDIAINYQYTEVGQYAGAATPPTMQLGIAAAIPVFYQQQGEILRAAHDDEAAGVAVEKAASQVANDVAQASAGVEAARQLVVRMEGGLLARAQKARDLLKITYEKGAASLLDYLDAERTFIATRLEYLTDLQNYRIAVAQLEQAADVDLSSMERTKR
jgi:cobalt-zinc-cadmium efflux system outer membrane protein